MFNHLRTRVFVCLLSGAAMAMSMSSAAETELERTFARGVYWPWERTKLNADAAGREFWQFVDETMAMLKTEYHCNLLWFVNGPDDPARVCDLAQKHGLKVLLGTNLAHLFVYGITDEKQVADAVSKSLSVLRDKPACAGYVLKDEPLRREAMQMEEFRRALQREDPTRPAIVVSMTGHTEPYALQTGFPIICTDIYHFGGPRSPNIPNPAATSQGTYRGAITALTDMAGQRGKIAWAMPQAFNDYWGLSWHDDKGNAVLEPGGYWHWRMPTAAEMHWQTWEAVRGGCKGVVYFSTLLDDKDAWKPGAGEIPEPAKKVMESNKANNYPLVQERVATGSPVCLTGLGGGPTPQGRTMGEDFKTLAAMDGILLSLQPAGFPFLFVDKGAAVATFENAAEPGIRYGVVVNDNLEQPATVELRFLPNVVAVTRLPDNTALALEKDAVGNEGLLRTALTLEPGMGALLKLECRNQMPGLLLFREDFAGSQPCATFENAERRVEPRGFGMGAAWHVRKTGGVDKPALVRVGGLQSQPLHGNPLAGSLAAVAAGKAAVYLDVAGSFPKAESLVVIAVDKAGKSTWLQSNNYTLPTRIPPDTEEIQVQLSADAVLAGLRFWRVPLEPAPK